MAYSILEEEYTACSICIDECPVEAISEGKDFYTIDAYVCTDCGACADACPNGAIQPESNK